MTIIDVQSATLFDGIDIEPGDLARRHAERLAGEFIAQYGRPRTQEAFSLDLRTFLSFIAQLPEVIDPLQIRRGHVDVWMRSMEARGLKPSTVNRRVGTICLFYRWLHAEEIIDRNPTANIKRPKVPRESPREWMGRLELGAWLDAGEREGGYPYALACLLGLNALRISEACNANVEDLGRDRYHYVLKIVGKGNQPAIVVVPPRGMDAIEGAIGDRDHGPLLLNKYGLRMKRPNAAVICRRLATKAGVAKNITPHSLRHSSITAYLNATDGDITGARDHARHADISTTTVYDRRRKSHDRAGVYVVSNYVAGGD